MEKSNSLSAKLSNGRSMPMIGLGTYQNGDKNSIANAIVDLGYRLIDTAEHYGNEPIVGEAIQIALSKGVKREELFIVTKLWVHELEDVEKAIKGSL